MANNNKHTGPNVPALRFPEFSGKWEKFRVSDFIEFFPTNSLSWDQLEYRGAGLLNLHYGMIHNGLPVQVDVSKNALPSIKEDYYPKKYTLCKEGDIAFADASEDTNDVGKAIEFNNCAGKSIVCGLHTIHGRDRLGLTYTGFKGYLFSSKVYHDQIKSIAQGTKVFSIKASNFDEVILGLPKKEEQKKISSLLMTIDDRILTQSKIIEDKETLYKAIIDKHFKEIRKNDAIQEVYLSNVFKERVEYSSNDGVFPHASLTKEGVNIKTDRYNRDFLVKDTDKQYKVTRINDICYNPANLKFGVITRNIVGTLIFSPIYVTFEVRNGYDPAYIELMVTNGYFVNKMLRFQEGTVYERMAVSSEDFLSESCKIPDLEIQTEFSAHVSKIEQSIQVEKKYLESICRMKNYILEAMFI